MKFKIAEARRVLSFCLDRAFDVELSDDNGRCSITISSQDGAAPPERFEADTFEETLHAAADAGFVRKECIERQIAFSKAAAERTFDARAGQWKGPAFPTPPDPATSTPEPERELALAHYRGLAEFRYQIRKFVSFSERAARQAGLEPSQHQLMLAIHGLPPTKQATLTVLAERMCTTVDVCAGLAQALLDRGYVRWAANPNDRREQLLAMSKPGLKVLKALTVLHRNQMLSVGPTFVQALGAILSSFEDV